MHDFSWINLWILSWNLCQDTFWYTRIHSFSWNYAKYFIMDFGLFSWERSYRKSYLKNIVKNIVKKYSEMMEFLCEFLIEPHWTHGRGAPTRRIWKGQAIPPLLLQSHLPHCQPVYFAELQCQYLPPWSYHTLSSCCQRAYRLTNWFKISLEFKTVRRAREKNFVPILWSEA